MKNVMLFKQASCPYCKVALKYLDELQKDPRYHNVKIDIIDEIQEPRKAAQYDYYYVPTFYVDGVKVSEGAVSKETLVYNLRKGRRLDPLRSDSQEIESIGIKQSE